MSIAVEQSRSRGRHRSRSFAHGSPDTAEQGLALAVEVLLGGVLVLSPLAYGGVEFGAQRWMMLGITVAIVIQLIRWFAYPKTFRPTFTWAYLPMLAFLALAVVQLLPLPSSIVSVFSPKATEAWNEVSRLVPGEQIHRSLSLYPLGTERQLRLLLLVCGVFAITFTHFRERVQIVRLLWALVVAGSFAGVVAISQNLTDGPSTWLGVTTSHPDSGPFMNHSAFGQFMNLCTGAALALLLVGLRRQIGDRPMSYGSLRHHLFRKSSAALLIPLLFIVISPVLVALSLTRGGVLSFVIAGSITGILLGFTHSGRGKRTLLAVLGFLILLVLLKFGFDRVYDRMASLRSVEDTGGGVRLQMVRDMVPMFRDFPIVGVGLGAFSHVFPTYDTAAVAQFATHAENEYAQLAVETGAVGIVLIALFLAVVAWNGFSAMRWGKRSIQAGSGGLIFGLLCILIHSASDFGQHVPAIACVTAVTTALLVRMGVDARAERKALATAEPPPAPARALRIAGMSVALVLLASTGWSFARTWTESDAESANMAAKRIYLELNRRGLDEVLEGEFITVIRQLVRAADLMPGDADYRYSLPVMRWQSIDRYDRNLTREFHKGISDECLKVLTVAPYYGPAMIFAGQVRAFDLGDASGYDLIRHGYSLARYSREACYSVAMLDAQEKQWDRCMEQLRRAIELGVSRADAATLLAVKYQRLDLAQQLVEGSRRDMVALATALDRVGRGEEAAGLLNKATEMLIAEANKDDAPLDALVQLAEAYIREGQYAESIPLLRRALVQRYDRADLRKQLIESLVHIGATDQAISEARINYRLNPGNAEAKQLMEDLVSTPAAPRSR